MKDPHQGHSVPDYFGTEHADLLLGTTLCVPTARQSYGQPFIASTLPDGGLHQ